MHRLSTGQQAPTPGSELFTRRTEQCSIAITKLLCPTVLRAKVKVFVGPSHCTSGFMRQQSAFPHRTVLGVNAFWQVPHLPSVMMTPSDTYTMLGHTLAQLVAA